MDKIKITVEFENGKRIETLEVKEFVLLGDVGNKVLILGKCDSSFLIAAAMQLEQQAVKNIIKDPATAIFKPNKPIN